MITLRNIEKSYGAQTLFDGASLQINFGDRLALVGPNGAGKSTLFRMILGSEAVDGGDIALRQGVSIGYLPQETPSSSPRPVLEEVTSGSDPDPRREAQAKKVLMGLGFRESDFQRPVAELSGGWQMRVMIARLLFEAPDLLMLDEPTNHLDLEALLWFQTYLRGYRGSLFVISHDRELINAVTSRIVEARQGRLKIYNGSYQDYVAQKKKEKEDLIAAYNRQQKEIQEIQTYINRFRAKATLASNVQSKIKYLERMEKVELPPEEGEIGFAFPQPSRAGRIAMELKSVRQSYDGKNWVYDGLDLIIERGQRIALVGPNAAGKSTLLKLLAGAVPFQEGERKIGHNVEVGYFSQHRAEQFKAGRNVFQEAADTRRAHSETTIRSVLGGFLFGGETVFKPVDVLSGGEKSRLGLAKLLLDPPNLLLMDEPTTHLDIASVDVLVDALRNFEGTVVFISHDVYFIRELANNIVHVNSGLVTWYPGDYDYFLHRKSQEASDEGALFKSEEEVEALVRGRKAGPAPAPAASASGGLVAERDAELKKRAAPPPPRTSGPKTKEQKRLEAEARNRQYRDKQEKKKINARARELEEDEGAILREMGKPETHRNPARVTELMKELGEIRKELAKIRS